MTIATLPFPASIDGKRLRIAVVGSGISGTSAAWALSKTHDVTLFEAGKRAGGHTSTVDIDYDGTAMAVDTGFIVYNELNYPNLTALFAHLGVETHGSDMSFALSLDYGKLEWNGSDYSGLFARKRNALSPSFLWMLREILRFNKQCVADRDSGSLAGLSIGDYLVRERFSPGFRDNYLVPMAAAIWSTPSARMLDFPAETFITFFDNHRLIHDERPQWRTVTGGSRNYLHRLLDEIGRHRVRLGTPVVEITRQDEGVQVGFGDGHLAAFDCVVLACHSDQALAILGDATEEESGVLSAIRFAPNRVVLHRDPALMPRRRHVWASWNYMRSSGGDGTDAVAVSYWMNRLQGIDRNYPLFVTLNPHIEPKPSEVFGEWTFAHPLFDAAAMQAQRRLQHIQGAAKIWYAGAWTGYGFHEDGLKSGLAAARALGGIIPWENQSQQADTIALAAE